MKTTFIMLTVLLAPAFNIPVSAADLNVTSTIHGTAGDASDYNIKSDGAPYIRVKSGKNVVESLIQGIGDWELNTQNSTTRKVWVDLTDPVVPGTPTPISPSLQKVRFLSTCTRFGNNLQLLGFGQSMECGLNFGFTISSGQYAIRMNPNTYPGTNTIRWTCTSMNITGACSAWTGEPVTMQGDGEIKSVGQLLKLTSKKGAIVEEPLGQFYFKFRFTLTAP